MTTFYLIRHATNDSLNHGILAGRRPGTSLNADGRRQAERLAARLASWPIHHLFSSPLERARETAAPLAKALGLPLRISEALNEIDFGDWTGQTVAGLQPLDTWKQWNLFRSGGRIPNGEMMVEVQARMVRQFQCWCREFTEAGVALVSHGDPIRATLAHYLGMPLDFVHRLEISPASVTILTLDAWSARLLATNLNLHE